MDRFVFSFRGFYWDYWRDCQTGEIIRFEMGNNPNEFLTEYNAIRNANYNK